MGLEVHLQKKITQCLGEIGIVLHRNGIKDFTVPVENLPIQFNFNIEHRDMESFFIPPILLVTLPKSGSMFLWENITNALRIKNMRISGSYFPDDLIMESWLIELAKGRRVSQEHIPARFINLRLLQKYLDRFVVHVRDPRQAILSWIYFMEKQCRERGMETLSRIDPPIDLDFLAWPLGKKLDYYLKNYFPQWVKWIEDWVSVDEDPDFKPKILFTQHREFQSASKEIFRKIFRFYGIEDESCLSSVSEPQKGKMHFRKGSNEEWRETYTSEQIEMTRTYMSDRILKKFSWEL